MKLSKRLSILASFVKENDIVADIGCDHAQLCCALVNSKKIDKAYACDIAQGPLMQAMKTIEYYNLQDKVITVLSDGLQKIHEDVTCIVIAGMGFETVAHILNQDIDKLDNKRIIVQVNRDVEGLRKWISDHNYHILSEKCVLEDQHYYQIVVFDTTYDTSLSEDEILFGRKMEKDNEFYSQWKFKLSQYEKMLRNMKEDASRYSEVLSLMIKIYTLFSK